MCGLRGCVESHEGCESFGLIANLQVSVHSFMDAGRTHDLWVRDSELCCSQHSKQQELHSCLGPSPTAVGHR